MIKHLACMMDGNRRWARKQGWSAIYGHRQGIETIKKVVDFCLKQQIPYLSLYTYSIENLKRSEEEKNSLWGLALGEANRLADELLKLNVRVRFVGDRSLFPSSLAPVCAEIEEKTKHGTALQLNFLFCYGSRQEIVGGVKEILRKVKAGELKEEEINEKTFNDSLWLGDIPEPDLVVRTGGAQYPRLSNFLLYQTAYSEYYFLESLWPALTMGELEKIVTDFEQRQRNFGT